MTRRHKITDDLVTVLRGFSPSDFPGSIDYGARFTTIADYLRTSVHTEIEKSALFQSIADGSIPPEQAVYLNNHGPGHVAQVNEQASRLLQTTEAAISPYEVYLLLVAIQLHDVGNVYGRTAHEKKCQTILASFGAPVVTDDIEKRYIALLAASHGGTVNGDRDTIGKLEQRVDLFGRSIRLRLLAAILRFADETADDYRRASRFAVNAGLVPEHSLIYHVYSTALHSVVVAGQDKEIRLSYVMDATRAAARYQHGNSNAWLLDEIYDRTLKMHQERVYCMRHLPPENRIDRIKVKIEVYQNLAERPLEQPAKTITYCLEEKGYPQTPKAGIHDLCPELGGYGGQQLHDELAT